MLLTNVFAVLKKARYNVPVYQTVFQKCCAQVMSYKLNGGYSSLEIG